MDAGTMSCEKIQECHWLNRCVNADGLEKVRDLYVCLRAVNVRKFLQKKKNAALKIGKRKVNARKLLSRFSRTSTCV